MEENKTSQFVFDILIVSAALVLTDLVGAMMHLTFLPWYKPMPSFITVLAVVFVCAAYAKRNEGQVRFGTVFGYGMKVSAAASVIVAVYTYLSLNFFFPELRQIAMDQAREVLSQREDMPQATVDSALAITERMFIPLAIIGAIISTMLISLVGGVISYFFSRPFLKGPGNDPA